MLIGCVAVVVVRVWDLATLPLQKCQGEEV